MLTSVPRPDLVLWGATTLGSLVLFSVILWRELYRTLPFFSSYLAVNLLQTILQVVVYQFYGLNSDFAYALIWGSQAVVVLARGLATIEFCYFVLGRFTGVWAMAIRVLLCCGAAVLATAAYFGRDGFQYAVTSLEIATEAFIATLVVGIFLFARYYQVQIQIGTRLLGLGLGFHSCVKVLNDALLSRYVKSYAAVWNEISMGVFLCAVLMWIMAARKVPVTEAPEPLALSPVHVYRTLAPQVNHRLWELNDHLMRLWKLDRPKP